MRASTVAKWVWYGWGGKPPRRVTGTSQTARRLADGSSVTTKTTTYSNGPRSVKTTMRYRLPDGSIRTESTTRPSGGAGAWITGFLAVGFLLLWPWAFHWKLWLEILIACIWYPSLLLITVAAVASHKTRLRPGRS